MTLSNIAIQYTTLRVDIWNKPPTLALSGSGSPYSQRFASTPVYISHQTLAILSDPDSLGIRSATFSLSPLLDTGLETLSPTYTSSDQLSLPIIAQELGINIRFGTSNSGDVHSHITHSLFVNESGTTSDVDVVVYIDHSWLGDITIELEHNGLRRTLVSQPGGALCRQDTLFHVVFDQQADAMLGKDSSTPGVCKFRSQGVFQPQESLTAFVGTPANGEWLLHVIDNVPASDNGVLVGWAVVIQPEGEHFVSASHSLTPPLLLYPPASYFQAISLSINSPGRITNLIPRIQIAQPYERGLLYLPQLMLTHPDGTQVQLSDETYLPCISGNYTYLIFSDKASLATYNQCQTSGNATNSSLLSSITDDKLTLIDTIKPVNGLSSLIGRQSGGEWLLTAWASRTRRLHLLGWSMHIATEPNIDSDYNSVTGVLKLTGLDSVGNYAKVIRSIQYNNTFPSPTFWVTRSIQGSLFDGQANSSLSRTFITLHHLVIDLDPNNSTSAAFPGFTTRFVEHSSSIPIVDPGVLLEDAYLSEGLYNLTFVLEESRDGIEENISVILPSSLVAIDSYYNSNLQFVLTVYPSFTNLSSAGQLSSISTFLSILRSATYSHTGEEISGDNRTVSVNIIEYSTGVPYPSFVATTFIQLVHTNDAPVLILNTLSQQVNGITNFLEYREGQGPLQLANLSTIRLYDHDHTLLQRITIQITNPVDVQYETLSISGTLPLSINYSYVPASFTLTLYGNATLDSYRTAISQVRYQHSLHPGRPNTVPRLVSFTPFDGEKMGLTTNAYISFASVNDPPIIGLTASVDFRTVFREEMGAISVVPMEATLFDIDNVTLDSVTVVIENVLDGTDETLNVTPVSVSQQFSNGTIQTITYTPIVSYPTDDRTRLVISGLSSVNEYQLILRTLEYNNLANEPETNTRNISITISDGLETAVAYSYVMIILVNDSPRLALGTSPFVWYIDEDTPGQGFTLTETDYLFEDDDLDSASGIAIVSVDCSKGVWQGRAADIPCTNDTANQINCTLDWFDISCDLNLNYAILARSKNSSRLRFRPNLHSHGNTSLKVVAWDGTNETGDILIKSAVSTSNIDAFSSEQTTLTIVINPINDAPVLEPIRVNIPPTQEDDFNSEGVLVSTLLTYASDVDGTDVPIGIALISVDDSNGVWQYQLYSTLTWYNISHSTVDWATLLDPNSRIRFKPNANFHGLSSFSFKAWDQFQGSVSGSIESTLVNNTLFGPFSIDDTTATLIIEPVNDSPRISSGMYIDTLLENVSSTINHGTLVRDIISGYYYDVDVVLESNITNMGLAVIGVYNRFGRWQYSCNASGVSWRDFIGDIQYGQTFPLLPLPDKATLLISSCRVRFVPDPYFNTQLGSMNQIRPDSDRPYIIVRAWDNTGLTKGRSGTYGNDASYASLSSTNEFSMTSQSVFVNITSRNDPPIIHLTNSTVQTFFTEFIEDLAGVKIVGEDLYFVDFDHDMLVSMTVTIVSGSSSHFEGNSTYCMGVDYRRETILYNLVDTDLEANNVSFCPFQIRFSPSSSLPMSSVHISQYIKVLKSLTYNNSIQEPSPGVRIIQVTASDGNSTSSPSYAYVDVMLVNDAPILDLNIHIPDLHSYVLFIEGEGPILLTNTSNIRLVDFDNRNLTSAVISLIPSPDMLHEVLRATTSGTNIISNYNTSTFTLTLDGEDSVENYALVLASVTYNNTFADPGNPNESERRVMFIVSDGSKTNTLAISFISFQGINNHPYLDVNGNPTGLDFTTEFTEEQGPIGIVDQSMTLTDIDNKTLSYVSVRIANPLDDETEFLSVDNVTLHRIITNNQLNITKIVETTHLIPNVTYFADTHELIISGLDTVEEYRQVMLTLQYNNVKDEVNLQQRVIHFYASDGLLLSPLASTFVTMEPANDPPYFISPDVLIFPQIFEDDFNSSGFSIMSLVSGLINDSDTLDSQGIAVIHIDIDNGVWQYRLDLGSIWLNINSNVSLYDALLLTADADNYIRFVPMSNFYGNVSFSFVAWDASDGYKDGERRSTSSSPTKNLDAFSHDARTLTLRVIPVNDAPVLISSEIDMPNILEDYYTSYGESVQYFTVVGEDVENSVFGIAIVSIDNTNGVWQYTLNNASTWLDISAPNPARGLLLRGNSVSERIRFVPSLNFNGLVSFNYKLWDLTTPEVSGSFNNTQTDSKTGPFSEDIATARVTVDPVNDSPIISSGMFLSPVNENVESINNQGTPISTVINGFYSDVDVNFLLGITVIGVDNRNGEFEHSCTSGGSTWTPFIGDLVFDQLAPRVPFESKATLLSDSCRIRFLPNPDFNTEYDLTGSPWTQDITPYLSVKGWDQTSGTAGQFGVDTTSSPDDITNAFSAEIVNITIIVNSVNHSPRLNLIGSENTFYTIFTEPSPPLRTVYPVHLVDVDSISLTDSDHIHLRALRIELSRNDGSYENILYDLSMTNLMATTINGSDSQTITFESSNPLSPTLLSYYVMLLKSLRYQNTAEEPDLSNRTVTFTLFDPELPSPGASISTTTISIQLVNDPPELDLDTLTTNLDIFQSYREGQGKLYFINSSRLSLIDHDSPILHNATITLTNPKDGIYEKLAASGTSNINVTFYSHTLYLIGPANLSEFRSVLSTISYEHTNSSPGNPDTSTRLITFSIRDESEASVLATANIFFSSMNNAPIIDLNGNIPGEDYSTVFYEQRDSISIVPADLFLMDIDNKTLDRITVTIILPTSDDFIYVDNVTLYSDNPDVAKTVILTNLRSQQDFNSSKGELVISGLDYVHEYATVLKTLRYNHTGDETGNFIKILTVVANDGILDSNIAMISINISEVNDAPFINNSIAVIRPFILEDVADSENAGILISEIINPIFFDVDAVSYPGIAIVNTDITNGIWEYLILSNQSSQNTSNSTASNTTWVRIPSFVSREFALLLRGAGELTRIRFVADKDFNGITAISFHAWDQSDSYPSGQTVSLDTSHPHTGAYSTESAVMYLDVRPVNDAPILQPLPFLTFLLEDEFDSLGIPLLDLVARVTDVDTDSQQVFGLAVVYNDNTNGYLQYTTTGGQDWKVINITSASNALLLSSFPYNSTMIRFVPNRDFNGQVELGYVAWDLTSGGAPFTYETTLGYDPITGPFSSSTTTVIITIEPVNDSPYFDGPTYLDTITEDTPNNGNKVSDIVLNSLKDVDVASQVGIAVINIDNRNGKWEWKCDESQSWQDFIGDIVFGVRTPTYPIPLRATLLAGDCSVRFLPFLNFNTENLYSTGLPRPQTDIPFISILAWDNTGLTSGRSGSYGVDTTYNNASITNEFSSMSSKATINVTSVNDIAQVQISQDGLTFMTIFKEDGGAIVVVEPSHVFITDADHQTLESVTVELERVYDTDFETLSLTGNPGIVQNSTGLYVNTTLNGVERLLLTSEPVGSTYQLVLYNPNPQARVSIAAYQTVLRTVEYNNVHSEPTNISRFIRFYVNDGVDVNSLALTTVSVDLIVENRPVLDLGVGEVTFLEDSILPLSIVSPNLTLTDNDHNEFFFISSADIFFEQPPESELEYLSVDLPSLSCNSSNTTFSLQNTSQQLNNLSCVSNPITSTYDSTQGHLTLSGNAPIGLYQATLRSTVYFNLIEEPTNVVKIITFQVFDTQLRSSPTSVTIRIQLRNDQIPRLIAGNVYQYLEQQPAVPYPLNIADNITYTDADSGDPLQGYVSISITNPIDAPYEMLSAFPQSDVIRVEYHTLDVAYSTTQIVEKCVNVTDNTTTSTVIDSTQNVTMNNSIILNNNTNSTNSSLPTASSPAPTVLPTVLRCENVTELVNRTNQTIQYTGLNLVGPASLSDFREAITTVVYTNGAEEPDATPRSIVILANDQDFNSNLVEVTVQVVLSNDIPVVDLNGFMIGTRFMATYQEASVAIPIVDSIALNVSDDDDLYLVSATAALTTLYDSPNEILNVSRDREELAVSYDNSTGILSISGNASVETYQSVLRTLTYQHLEGDPGAPNTSLREVVVVVSDSLDSSLPAYSIITFLAVNDPPFLDLNGNLPGENATVDFVEEGEEVRVFSDESIIMDIDSGTLANLTISLLNPVDGVSERIFIDPAIYSILNPMGSIDVTSSSIILSNFLSLTKYILALQNIFYINTKDEPLYDDRLVEVTANDGMTTNILYYTGTIRILPVNDPPQFSFDANINSDANYSVDYFENSAHPPVIQVVSSDFSLADDDDASLTLIIERDSSPDGDFEKLFFLSATPISGLNYTYSDCPLKGESNPLTLDLSISLTLGQWILALGTLSYCNMDPNSFGGIRRIKIVLVDDEGARSAPRYSFVNVIPINDPPIFQGPPPSESIDEDSSVTITILSRFTDYEQNLLSDAIEILTPPGRGMAVINPAGDITYTPLPDDNGVVTFQFRACDPLNNCSVPVTATITIVPVNDPPTPVGDGIIMIDEDGQVQVNLLDYFTDVEDTPTTNNTRVIQTPRGGSWEYKSDLEIFIYSPTQHSTGDDSLIFEACDNGGLCINITLVFRIRPVNDVPIITIGYTNGAIPLVINEDTNINISVTITDVEDNDLLDLEITSVSNGEAQIFIVSGNRLAINIFEQVIYIEYEPNFNYYGPASISFTATDNENAVSTATIQIDVVYHNDPPMIGITSLTIQEDTQLELMLPQGLDISDSESVITPQQIEFLTNPGDVVGTISYENTTGNLSYLPPTNFNDESVSFFIRVCDTDLVQSIECLTSEISIFISPVNDAPIFTQFNFFVKEDSSNSTNLLPYVSDIEDTTIMASKITIVAPFAPNGNAQYDSSTGDITYTPNPNFSGTDSITLSICDSENLCSNIAFQVSVIPVNDPPSADGFSHITPEDEIDLINFEVIIIDVDTPPSSSQGIRLRISIVLNSGGSSTLVDSGSTSQGGRIRVFQEEEVISYEPPSQFIGYDNFTYAVCDRCDISRNSELGRTSLEDTDCLNQIDENNGSSINPATGLSIACSVGTVVITVINTNDVPSLRDISNSTATDQEVILDPFGDQTLFNDDTLFVYDEDDNQLSFALSQGFNLTELGLINLSNINKKVITIQSEPAGGSYAIKGSDRVYITYTPNPGFTGYDELTYEICDLNFVIACGNAIARVFVSSPGPRIDSLVVSGSEFPRNSKVSAGDQIVVTFSENTNQPPRIGKDDDGSFCDSALDQIVTFALPFIDPLIFPNAYCAVWDDPRTLTITLSQSGYPEPHPKIGTWRVSVTKDPNRICSGFNVDHRPYTVDEIDSNCLLNADQTSLPSDAVSPTATGDWGVTLPMVSSAIIQNLNTGNGDDKTLDEKLIKIQLQQPFSSEQLSIYCAKDITDILNFIRLGTDTRIDLLQPCSNLLQDGTNADQYYRDSHVPTRSQSPMAVFTELIFQVVKLSDSLQQLTDNQLLEEFLGTLRQAPFADVVKETLNVDILVDPDDPAGQIGGLTPTTEQVDVDTPAVISAVAQDPDNLDGEYSDFDVIRITFSVPTSQPPVGSKNEMDKIFVFTPNLGVNYLGTWESSSILLVVIIDSARSQPNETIPSALNLKLEFLPNYFKNVTLLNSTMFPADRLHCFGDHVCTSPPAAITVGVCNAAGTSCRARAMFDGFTGDFGTALGTTDSPVGVIAGTITAIIIVIVFVVIVFIILLLYYCYRRIQEKRDRDKALALVRSWKQKQIALSEQQKKPSMLAVDESWRSPPTMPLMRDNIDPFSAAGPMSKPSMDSGTFLSPTQPFQPRAYPSILDSSLIYPTAGSALPPIPATSVSFIHTYASMMLIYFKLSPVLAGSFHSPPHLASSSGPDPSSTRSYTFWTATC